MDPGAAPPRARRLGLGALVALATLLVAGLVLELGARALGREPFRYRPPNFRVEPGDELTRPHPFLGYSHLPGAFTVVFGDGGRRVRMTHGEDTLRLTRPPGAGSAGRPGLWFLGCSFTHGWSVDDEDSFPWRVQAALPGVDVVNFGVSGYGTLHSYLQLREALAAGRVPARVVVVYAWFHEERSTFLRQRRKQLAGWVSHGTLDQPFARLDARGELVLAPPTPALYPLLALTRYSAALDWLDEAWNAREAERAEAHRVTLALLQGIQELCARHSVELLVAGITADEYTRHTLQECRLAGMRTLDIGVDLFAPGNNNLPYDGHPSAAAHAVYAERLVSFLGERGARPLVLAAEPERARARPGERLALRFAFDAAGLARDHGLLVHVVDPAGRTVLKSNHLPPVPTSRWTGRTSWEHALELPGGLGSGVYEIWVGLGEPGGGLVPLHPGPGVSRDALGRHHVASFRVER
jgi:hypothetical protein